MTYFKLILGLDCGIDKSVCQSGYPENCFNCLSKKFSETNFLVDLIEITEQSLKEKRKELLYNSIWRKYQDISTIRHIIILTKGGLPAFNMAISDLPIEPTLISGFIQANISFASKELTFIDKINPEKKLYEFEYKNFHILLCNGDLCRMCLILDKRASYYLRELVSNFMVIFEDKYEDKIKEVEELCDTSILDSVRSIIENIFETYMNYPLSLSSLIPPDKIENLPLIQKAIYECTKELLKDETYFFISHLMATTSKLLGVISNEEIVWNIRQLMLENIIIWQIQKQLLEKQKKGEIFQKTYFEENIFETHDMSNDDAQIKINSLMKNGEISEMNTAYQEALNEYQAALFYAKEFNMELKINEISLKIFEITKLNRNVELNFAMKQADKSEFKRDYVIALKYLLQIKNLLTDENHNGEYDKQLHKLNRRIKKIQKRFQ